MSPVPPNERPSARELRDGIAEPQTIAGKPADVCPYCGCGLFVNGTHTGSSKIDRYVVCRNRSCGKRFVSRQPPAFLLREIEKPIEDNFSSPGNEVLTLFRDSA
jgi:hypothetical protein